MSEEVQANGQAPVGGEGGQAPTQSEPKTFDAEYVQQLRAEAARWRTEAQAAKAKATEYEQAQMTEAQRLAAQAATAQAAAEAAQAELRKARAEAAIAREAAKTGVDPALLTKLVHDAVEYDANGAPTNIDAAVAAAIQQWPHIKPAPAAPAVGASNPGRAAKLTIEDVKRMSPEQVNARWDEVQVVLAGG